MTTVIASLIGTFGIEVPITSCNIQNCPNSCFAEESTGLKRFRLIPEDIRDDTVSACQSFWSIASSSSSLTLGNLHSLIASIAPIRRLW
jgi:hypothetical protein